MVLTTTADMYMAVYLLTFPEVKVGEVTWEGKRAYFSLLAPDDFDFEAREKQLHDGSAVVNARDFIGEIRHVKSLLWKNERPHGNR